MGLCGYKITDATVESLGEILIENPWGVLAYRDELHGLLKSLDKEGQEGARAFYLQAYDGNLRHRRARRVFANTQTMPVRGPAIPR